MWIKVVFIANILIPFVISQDVGAKCPLREKGLKGTCTEVPKCGPAVQSIIEKKNHEFERCGFIGQVEVVCCPPVTNEIVVNSGGSGGGDNSSRTQAQIIADRECQKIIIIEPLFKHIFGGETASNGEYPHTVALGIDLGDGYDFICGGSVLSNSYVLTAAHCVHTRLGIKPTIVRGGVVELGAKQWNNKTDVKIAEIIEYPNYTVGSKYHDLALLRLERPLQFSSELNAICLETSEEDPKTPLTITGWGVTNNEKTSRSNVLLKANVTVVASDKCNESYTNVMRMRNGISADQMCAGDPQGIRDTCQGDSGGPLLSTVEDANGLDHHRLVGVTSFGNGCGGGVPGVYTRVNRYLAWIVSVVWPN